MLNCRTPSVRDRLMSPTAVAVHRLIQSLPPAASAGVQCSAELCSWASYCPRLLALSRPPPAPPCSQPQTVVARICWPSATCLTRHSARLPLGACSTNRNREVRDWSTPTMQWDWPERAQRLPGSTDIPTTLRVPNRAGTAAGIDCEPRDRRQTRAVGPRPRQRLLCCAPMPSQPPAWAWAATLPATSYVRKPPVQDTRKRALNARLKLLSLRSPFKEMAE